MGSWPQRGCKPHWMSAPVTAHLTGMMLVPCQARLLMSTGQSSLAMLFKVGQVASLATRLPMWK